VLEGSVRKAGEEVRITAQLIRADDGFHLWSETWNRTLEDIFAIQDQIAADVADQLKVTLLGEAPKVEETDPEAYSLFLQARHLNRQFTAESIVQADDIFMQVLAIDSTYAPAWAGRARNYATQIAAGLRPQEEGLRQSKEYARRALEIDPNYAWGYAVLGGIAYGLENDLLGALRDYERALELDPNDMDVLTESLDLLRNLGRLDESIAIGEHAVARDPINASLHSRLAITYFTAGRLDESIAAMRTSLRLIPGRIAGHYWIGLALFIKGEPEAALASFAQEEADPEYRVKGMALALYELGRIPEFEAAFAELREGWGERWPSEIAHVYAWIGDADAAFEWLDRAVAQNEDGLNQQFDNPLYRRLHDDPRWAAFLEETGTSPEQLAELAAIKFEVRLPQ